MSYSARFTNEENAFSIERSGAYGFQINVDWMPPASANRYSFAGGSSLNILGGSELVSRIGQDVEFSVPLTAFGATVDHLHAQIRALGQFLQSAKYFEVKYSALPTPNWGQHGAYMRYEIVTVEMSTDSELNSATQPTLRLYVNLRVKPRFYGASQSPVAFSGGVGEDILGMISGQSRGFRVMEGTVNKMTNPAFSHATWNTGWTAGANVLETKNTTRDYCYPGAFVSALLGYQGGAGSTYTQSINAGNTNKHALSAAIYYPGPIAPTSSDVVLYYGADKTTTFVSKGNGVYLLYCDDITGINSATATGIDIKRQGVSLYLMAIQFEEKTYHSPISHGDMIGCEWTSAGTRGAATTTRAAGDGYTSDIWTPAGGAVEIIWIPDNDYNKSNGTAAYFLRTATSSYGQFYFNYSDAKFYLTDGTNTISSSATTFSAGDRIHLIGSMGPSGLAIYRDGVSIASGTDFTPKSATVYPRYIGSDSGSNFSYGVFATLCAYPNEVTAAQALALYNDSVNYTYPVSPIPWSYANDAKGRISLGTDTTYQNCLVFGGIAGDTPARTTHRSTIAGAVINPDAFYLSILPVDYKDYVDPRNEWFYDLNGSASANYFGGGYTQYTTGNYPAGKSVYNTRIFTGKHNFFMRMARSATSETVSVTPRITKGYQNLDAPQATSCAIDTTARVFYVGTINIDASMASLNPLWLRTYEQYLFTTVFNASGTVYVDFVADLPGEIVKFINSNIAVDDLFIYDQGRAILLNSSLDSGEIITRGANALDLHPGKLTYMFGIIGENADATDDDANMVVTTSIEPAWSLV